MHRGKHTERAVVMQLLLRLVVAIATSTNSQWMAETPTQKESTLVINVRELNREKYRKDFEKKIYASSTETRTVLNTRKPRMGERQSH